MKRLLMLLVVVILASASLAQDLPRTEVFGGYQFVSFDNPNSVDRYSLNGFNADVAFRTMKHFSLVGDFGADFKTVQLPGPVQGQTLGMKVRFYPVLFGPRVSFRTGKLAPFAEVLFGFGHLSRATEVYNKFAAALGGGADWKMTKHAAIRLAKIDYLLLHFTAGPAGNGQANPLSANLNNVRVATGLVFDF